MGHHLFYFVIRLHYFFPDIDVSFPLVCRKYLNDISFFARDGLSSLVLQKNMTYSCLSETIQNIEFNRNSSEELILSWGESTYDTDSYQLVIDTVNDTDTSVEDYYEDSKPIISEKIDELCTYLDDFMKCYQEITDPIFMNSSYEIEPKRIDMELLESINGETILSWNCTKCENSIDYYGISIQNVKSGAKYEYQTDGTELDISELKSCEKHEVKIWPILNNGTIGYTNSRELVLSRMYRFCALNLSYIRIIFVSYPIRSTKSTKFCFHSY